MWTVIYIAINNQEAERIKQTLTAEGLLVKLRSLGGSQKKESSSVEILVPESEADEALEIINLA